MTTSCITDFTKNVLVRKTAGEVAATAAIWASINFMVLAIIVGDL